MKKLGVLVVMVVLVVGGIAAIVAARSGTTPSTDVAEPAKVVADETESDQSQDAGGGMTAMKNAARAEKYLFAFFRKEENDQTAAMRSVLQEAIKEVTDRADSVEVDVTAPSEEGIVKKYDLDRAPMPLILALAPNGAVTGGFPTKVEKEQLLASFASPCTEKCMKQLQENRLVFLCVQNATTESNDAAMEGVRQFKADDRFAQATKIVMLDPADTAEAGFLKDLQIDPKAKAAVTVFLAPPGVPIAMYEGATNKDEIVSTLVNASSACGPGGCGPGGCGPGSCAPPK